MDKKTKTSSVKRTNVPAKSAKSAKKKNTVSSENKFFLPIDSNADQEPIDYSKYKFKKKLDDDGVEILVLSNPAARKITATPTQGRFKQEDIKRAVRDVMRERVHKARAQGIKI